MALKLNIAYPEYGSQKMLEIEDDKKIRIFMDRRLAEEVPGDALGDEFKGYVFKITGGFDQQGFAMKQGVLLNHRTRLVLDGSTGFYTPKRKGCRKRKSVRGCIVGPDISCINLVIVKKGAQELPGLTDPDSNKPSMRGPKRASKIRKLWGLSKDEDVRQFVSRKKLPEKDGKKERYKSPKIQRLVTPQRLQRKRRRIALKKRRFEKNQKQASEYAKVLNQMRKEKRQALLSKKRAHRESTLSVKGSEKAGEKTQQSKPAQQKPAAQKGQTKTQPKAEQTKATQQTKAPAAQQKPAAQKGQTKAPQQQQGKPGQKKTQAKKE